MSAVIDLYDLSIVAHTLSTRNGNQLVQDTIDKAFQKNTGAQPQIHSDPGLQYTSYMHQALIGGNIKSLKACPVRVVVSTINRLNIFWQC